MVMAATMRALMDREIGAGAFPPRLASRVLCDVPSGALVSPAPRRLLYSYSSDEREPGRLRALKRTDEWLGAAARASESSGGPLRLCFALRGVDRDPFRTDTMLACYGLDFDAAADGSYDGVALPRIDVGLRLGRRAARSDSDRDGGSDDRDRDVWGGTLAAGADDGGSGRPRLAGRAARWQYTRYERLWARDWYSRGETQRRSGETARASLPEGAPVRFPYAFVESGHGESPRVMLDPDDYYSRTPSPEITWWRVMHGDMGGNFWPLSSFGLEELEVWECG